MLSRTTGREDVVRKELFRPGGPMNMKKSGPTTYTGSVTIEPGEDGMVARACPEAGCTPGYFRVKFGTGITGPQAKCYCPYCARTAEPSAFTTGAQIEYAKAMLFEEAKPGLNRMFRGALGLNSSGKRTLGGGLISIEMTMEPLKPRPVGRPVEEELRRDLTCPHCTLVHAVFGLAFTCPDCGEDIFLVHVREELAVVGKILEAVPERGRTLGQRVAARDVENALEDVVSIFECVMKLITRRALATQGKAPAQIDAALAKVRNKYQSVAQGAQIYQDLTGAQLFAPLSPAELHFLTDIFEKRHPITHNLGVVDRKYLERAVAHALEGRELRVTSDEIRQAIGLVDKVTSAAYQSVGGANLPTVATSGGPPPQAATPASPTESTLEGLSPAATQAVEYLIRNSEHGLDRDPAVPLSALAIAIGMEISTCRGACAELASCGWIWEDEEFINSDWAICPKPTLFQAFDRHWMGNDVVADAMTLVGHVRANADMGLVIPSFAETLGWTPRRINPALEYLSERSAIELGPYAHPYLAHWVRENENTRNLLDAPE